jgi:hypothetical protein
MGFTLWVSQRLDEQPLQRWLLTANVLSEFARPIKLQVAIRHQVILFNVSNRKRLEFIDPI